MKIAEYHEATELHKWLEVRQIVHTHVVNEQPSKQRAIAEKRMGKSAGVPDYLIFLPNGVNVAIELKEPSGKNKASKDQMKWLKFLSTRGFKCAVAYGWREAVGFLQECGYRETQSINDNQPF